jgi:hypothetical protein
MLDNLNNQCKTVEQAGKPFLKKEYKMTTSAYYKDRVIRLKTHFSTNTPSRISVNSF